MKYLKVLFYSSIILLFYSQSLFAGNARKDIKPLVSTSWLQQNLDDENLVILHVGRPDSYEDEHIPGSRLISMRSLIVKTEKLSHEFPEEAVIDSILKSAGINDDSRIVISYESGMMIPIAARLYVTLDYAGLGSNTSLLDGGLQKWIEEDMVVTDEVPEYLPGNYKVNINHDVLTDSKWISDNLGNPDFVLIDSRPEEQYEGREEESHRPRPGHIKGAVNLPFFQLSDDDIEYQFKSEEKLRELFKDRGIKEGATVATYCGTGIWACPFYVAAKQLGYKVMFYDGSFEEWSADETLPVMSPVNIEE